jgi:Prp8 binding protein
MVPPVQHSYGVLRLGKGTPTSIAYTSPTTLVAGSSDHTVFLFDLQTGEVLRRFRGHKGVVNAVDVQRGGAGRGLIASASDDGTVRVWSEDAKEELEVVELGYPITAVSLPQLPLRFSCFAVPSKSRSRAHRCGTQGLTKDERYYNQVKWSEDGQSLFIGGLDNDVHVFSLTTHAISYTLRSHSDTVTSLALSPTNSQLLSCGMDSTLHLWSVQPFAPTINPTNPALHPRLVRSFYGAPAGFEQLLRRASFSRHASPEGQKGTMVAVGGADRAVTVWDTTTGEIRYKVRLTRFSFFVLLHLADSYPTMVQLPGHTGTVISTAWSPKEPILASGGVEGVIYLGEVDAV